MPAPSRPPAGSWQLDQFLKWHNIVPTGGQAKRLIQGGEVKLNGVVETRRKKKLKPGDVIEVGGRKWIVPPEPEA
ncbi:MAG: RNA-binding S4 domain-containing protein [Caldilineae bacterium]|nr:MAG: RNA-binding S4 domain-containing protein [Caldilineae bacterium]